PSSTLFPSTPLFRSSPLEPSPAGEPEGRDAPIVGQPVDRARVTAEILRDHRHRHNLLRSDFVRRFLHEPVRFVSSSLIHWQAGPGRLRSAISVTAKPPTPVLESS